MGTCPFVVDITSEDCTLGNCINHEHQDQRASGFGDKAVVCSEQQNVFCLEFEIPRPGALAFFSATQYGHQGLYGRWVGLWMTLSLSVGP